MNILFIKLSAIGDVVQTLPALEAIKKTYPDSNITWVVEDAAADILDGHPLISRLLVSRRKSWTRMLRNPLTFFQGLGGIVRFFSELRSTRYDIAIDFQGLFKSGILIGLAGALGVTRFMRTLLFGVSPFDIASFVGVSVALGVIALVASWIPARRAARVDPVEALRYE